MRGADGWTDHRLVRSILQLRFRPPIRRQAPRPCLNIKALSDQEKRAALQAELLANLAPPAPNDNPATTDTLSVRWRTVSEVLLNTARSVLAVSNIAKQQIDPADGVRLSYRLDGNLFNIRRLQAKTRVTEEAIHELQYADDTAIIGSSHEGLQRTINAVTNAYTRSGLAININKTEVLSMHEHPREPVEFSINQQPLKNVQEFTYLGSVLTDSYDNGVMRHSKREVISRALLVDAYASQGLDSSATSESIECNRTEPDSSVFFSMVQSHRRLRRTTLSK
ncbi:hypothetical protein Pcinc_014891 [Petrolisthes cinctipes]|uniref:Reverse transcriptase domain-containing protein n=1 Tax=Petrolisthes cinctipes TaxID=88211 RepID=A0AAE1FU32_PETCI|nr:hypothetical protein Pcinc_014891 [Petrolisthes cinctipes]